MAEAAKTLVQLIAEFADNFSRDITPERLRDFLVSVNMFGSRYRATTGTQTPGTTPVIIAWDATGVDRGSIAGTNDMVIPPNGAGDWEVFFDATVDLQINRNYKIHLAVNGTPVQELGNIDGKGDIVNFSGSRIVSVVAADNVAIYIEASGLTSDFFLQVGSRFALKRLL